MADSYLREFDANVLEATEDGVALDRTCFYPKGGGVPCDQGWLQTEAGKCRVVEVGWVGGEVLHKLAGDLPPLRAHVRGTLDWELRYMHMRHHTALHILSGVVYRIFGSLITGGQVYADRARIDFDLENLDTERVSQIRDLANQVVIEGRPVLAKMLSRDEALRIPDLARTKSGAELIQKLEQVRVVEIKDFDAQADGGPHVSNTREVGAIQVIRTESKGKQNKRMEIGLD